MKRITHPAHCETRMASATIKYFFQSWNLFEILDMPLDDLAPSLSFGEPPPQHLQSIVLGHRIWQLTCLCGQQYICKLCRAEPSSIHIKVVSFFIVISIKALLVKETVCRAGQRSESGICKCWVLWLRMDMTLHHKLSSLIWNVKKTCNQCNQTWRIFTGVVKLTAWERKIWFLKAKCSWPVNILN